MNNLYHVSIGHLAMSIDPHDVQVIYGLGSCVAVIMYDDHTVVGGMLHALLPTQTTTSSKNRATTSTLPTKFVDQGILLLLKKVLALGAKKERLRVYLCGGAQVVSLAHYNDMLNIGQRNVAMAQSVLKQNGLRIQVQAVGGKTGRTIKFYLADGQITVKKLGETERPLTNHLPIRRNS